MTCTAPPSTRPCAPWRRSSSRPSWPRAREFDEAGRPDKAIFRRLGELGLLGIRYDPKYGGQGLDYSYHAVFLEELTLCDNAGVAMGVTVQTDMATPALARFGSEALKEQYLVPAIRGEQVAAIAVTEPGAGSDVARITTRAVRDGAHWVINGSKMFITNTANAEMMIQITAAEELARRCIGKMTRGEDVTLDVSMAKVFIANMKQSVATTCVQLFGGAGYIWENPAARAYVDWRLGTIGGGADEVMKEVVAKILKI